MFDLWLSGFASKEHEWRELLPNGIELVYYDSQTEVAIYRIPRQQAQAAD